MAKYTVRVTRTASRSVELTFEHPDAYPEHLANLESRDMALQAAADMDFNAFVESDADYEQSIIGVSVDTAPRPGDEGKLFDVWGPDAGPIFPDPCISRLVAVEKCREFVSRFSTPGYYLDCRRRKLTLRELAESLSVRLVDASDFGCDEEAESPCVAPATTEHSLVFCRYLGGADAIVLAKFRYSGPLRDASLEHIQSLFEASITKWIGTTVEGANADAQAGGSFNIGDLACGPYLRDILLQEILQENNLEVVSLDGVVTEGAIPYYRHLNNNAR